MRLDVSFVTEGVRVILVNSGFFELSFVVIEAVEIDDHCELQGT